MSWSCTVLYKIDKSRYYLLLCACVWDRHTHVSHIKISQRPCDRWTLFTCISHAVVVGPDIARKHRCSLVVCFCPSEDRNVSWEKPREVTRHEKASEANRIFFFFLYLSRPLSGLCCGPVFRALDGEQTHVGKEWGCVCGGVYGYVADGSCARVWTHEHVQANELLV